MNRTPTARIVLGMAVIYLVWGSTYLGIRFAVETLPPLLMTAARFLCAGSVLYFMARWQGSGAPTGRQWLSAGMLGSLLIVGPYGGGAWAQKYVPSGLAAMLCAAVPLWITLFEWLRPGGKHPGTRILIGLGLGFAGLFWLVGQKDLDEGPADFWALVVLVTMPMLWSLGSLYSRNANLPRSVMMSAGMPMLTGGTILTGASILVGERWNVAAISRSSVIAFAYLTLFGSLLACSVYLWLLRVANPVHVSTYAFVNPVIATFLGWSIAGEQLTLTTILAGGTILASVALILLARSEKLAPSVGKTEENGSMSEPNRGEMPNGQDAEVLLTNEFAR